MNEAVNRSVSRIMEDKRRVYNFCSVLYFAYGKAFTAINTRSRFIRSGIWPLDPMQLLSIARPASMDNSNTVLSVEELENILEEKRREFRETILGWDATVCSNGFVDTTQGAVLTSSRALNLARLKKGKTMREKCG